MSGEFVKSVLKGMILIGLFGVLEVGCVAQQADVARIQKDLEQQIGQLKSAEIALRQQIKEARSANTESQSLIAVQKADMNKMRSDLAPLNQQIKLLREQDLTSLYGQIEVANKTISDLQKDFDAHKGNFSTTTGTLQSDIQSIETTMKSHGEQLQVSQVQTTTLVQQIDEKNQGITTQLTDFQTSFEEFKRALTDIETKLTTETQRASSAETQLSADIINQVQHVSTEFATQQQALQVRSDDLSQSILQLQETLKQSGTLLGTRLDEQTAHQTQLAQKVTSLDRQTASLGQQSTSLGQQITSLQKKLDTDTQALRTFLDQDVKITMAQLVSDMDDRQRPVVQSINALQSDMEALGIHLQADAMEVQKLSQSVVMLREAQNVTGSLLGKRGDDMLQRAGRLSERMNTIESYQETLGQQLQSNTEKTLTHLTKVNARLTQQEKAVVPLNQGIHHLEEFQDKAEGQIKQMQAASQLADQLRQSVEHNNARLQDLGIHQSGLVGKLDADAQTTTTHLQEVNKGIKSVAQALENVSATLHARIAKQEQELNRSVTSFQSVQNSVDTAQANVQHLNELTETMNQLQGVINTIGTKLGERVDEHEDRLGQLAKRVNHLQRIKPKK